MALQVVPGDLRQVLCAQGRRHGSGHLPDPPFCFLRRGRAAAEDRLQRHGEAVQLRQGAQGAETPFIIGPVAAVQQENDRQRAVYEFVGRKLRCRRLAVPQAAVEIVLPCLRHQQKLACQALSPHVLGKVPQ